MKWEELKIKEPVELKEVLAECRAELHQSRLQAKSGQLKQVHKINNLKKTIARISMLLK